jgi:adenylate cyclase
LLGIMPAVAAGALLLLVRQTGLTERLNLFAYDLALQLRPAPSGASTPVRIIGIDEQDLALYGSQVPDAVLADAVERLDRLGVRAIGLDMFCGQPVGLGWRRLQSLAATNPRLVSVYFTLDGKSAIPGTPPNRQANADLYIDPQDGVLRRDVLHVTQGSEALSVSLPIRLLRIAKGRSDPMRSPPPDLPSSSLLSVGAGGYLPSSGVSAPAYQQRMLSFHQPGSFPTWPLRTLLRDPLPEAMIHQLRSSIVLIGVVAPSSKDSFAVPFSSWRAGQRRYELPGVEIHAHRLAALLAAEEGGSPGIQAAPRAMNVWLVLLAVAAGVVLSEGVASLRRSFVLAAIALQLGMVVVAASLAMGVWVDGALPLLAFVLSATAGWLRRGRQQQIKGVQLEQRNRQARSLFDRFVSRNVAEVLLESGNPQGCDQQLRTVTILFSDLRGFSLITAEHPPAVVVRLLNTYLEVMFDVVEQFGGTVDEVIGDALLVLFGAPHSRSDHADVAVACAIQMQLAMEQVNSSNRQQNLPELAMGIGLCTGDVMAGPIGSGLRAKYAVVGSAVNHAARIESLTVGGEIFAAEATVHSVGVELRLDSQHQWQVKGSGTPLRVFSIGAIAGAYNLALPTGTRIPTPLPQPLAVTCQRMEGKTRLGPPRQAMITHLSEEEAWLLPMLLDLEPFADLVLRFPHLPGDVYAKVREGEPAADRVRIVFTTMPAELKDWLRSPRSRKFPPDAS